MPAGVEVVLGIVGRPNIEKLLAAYSIDFDFDSDEGDGPEWELIYALHDSLDFDLVATHKTMLERIGFRYKGKSDITHGPAAVSPTGGIRDFSPLCLECFYDPDEMGQTWDTAVLGVSLLGRYFPSFLDWMYPHGGSMEVVSLNQFEPMVKIAREEIGKVFPWLKDAEVLLVPRWY